MRAKIILVVLLVVLLGVIVLVTAENRRLPDANAELQRNFQNRFER